MKKFTDVEELVSYMYDTVTDECPVTAIVSKDMAIDMMQEFLSYDNTNVGSLEFTDIYDKEYQVVLEYDADDETYDFYINYAYDYETERYYGIDGVVLFHEDVNSKALIDMQSDEDYEMTEHDWFTFDGDIDESEDDEVSDEEDTELEDNKNTDNKYFVNGKQATKEQYDEVYKSFIRSVLSYCEFIDKKFIDEMNEFRELFNWKSF